MPGITGVILGKAGNNIMETRETQFGVCAKCRGVSSCQPGKHNIIVTQVGRHSDDYFPSHAYDMCDDCLADLLDYIETDKSAGKEALE
jgi:hypothetical protein